MPTGSGKRPRAWRATEGPDEVPRSTPDDGSCRMPAFVGSGRAEDENAAPGTAGQATFDGAALVLELLDAHELGLHRTPSPYPDTP